MKTKYDEEEEVEEETDQGLELWYLQNTHFEAKA